MKVYTIATTINQHHYFGYDFNYTSQNISTKQTSVINFQLKHNN